LSTDYFPTICGYLLDNVLAKSWGGVLHTIINDLVIPSCGMLAVRADGENDDASEKRPKNESDDLFFHSLKFNTNIRAWLRPNEKS